MEYKSVGLEGLLSYKNKYAYTHKERVLFNGNPIRFYEDSYGKIRGIYIIGKEIVSGMCFEMDIFGDYVLTDMFTKENYRRKGYATYLYNWHKEYISDRIRFSKNLSELGKLFSNKMLCQNN